MSSEHESTHHQTTGVTSGGMASGGGGASGGAVMPQSVHSGINMPLVFTVVAFSAIVVAAAVIGTQAWFYHQIELERLSKSLGQKNQALMNLRFEQLQRISTYRWVDPQRGLAAIPIDKAIELTAQAYQRGENLRMNP